MILGFLLAVLAFRNVTVVDVNGARPGTTVIVSDGRIAAAGTSVKVPAGAKVIEGKGKYLIPALWDMHVHLWEQDAMAGLYLAAGITGIRDMGSDLSRTMALRAGIDAGRAAGPTIYTSGPPVDGPDSKLNASPVIKVRTPEEARQAVDKVEKDSADFVKVLSTLSEDAYFALAQRARVVRMPFAGHLPEDVTAWDAVDARQKSIEHLFGIALSCSYDEKTLRRERKEAIANKDYAKLRTIRSRTYSTYNPGLANDLFRRMARMGVWQTPTLTMRKRLALIDLDQLAGARELKYVPEAIRKSWTDPREELGKASAEQIQNFREDYDFHAKLVGAMQRSGVGILAGTDTGDPYVVPGFALHDELIDLVAAGLTTGQAIASATILPARYLGIEDSYGTVDRGKVASLVLLNADPLADIRNTRRISAVVHRGKLLDGECIDTLLKGKKSPCALAPPVKAAAVPVKSRPPVRKRGRQKR